MPDPAQCEQAVTDALGAGYRLIDTAAAYMNEEAVGAAIKKSGVPRSDLFINTKLWVSDASYESAKKAFETSLNKLGLEYLDLYLLHQPMGDYYGAYRAMEELYKEGVIRAIGVCNFYPHVLADFCETVEVIPAVNQVELHPFFQQENALALMKEYEVTPEAWVRSRRASTVFSRILFLRRSAKIRQDRGTGGTALERSARSCCDPEICSQGSYAAKYRHLGFQAHRRGNG